MPRQSCVRVYIHFVWATWDRLPLITPDIRDEVYRLLLAKCQEMGAHPLALGGIEDHMHLLVRMPATVTIAKLIGDTKGAATHAINVSHPDRIFKWQGAYGAFAVPDEGVSAVQTYINNQEAHHHTIASCQEWQKMEAEEQQRLSEMRTLSK